MQLVKCISRSGLDEFKRSVQLTSAWPCDYTKLARNVNDGSSLIWLFGEQLLSQHIPQLRPTAQPRSPVINTVQPIKCIRGHIHGLDCLAAQDARAVDGIVEAGEVAKDVIVE